MKKGFTLIEMLVAIVLLSLLIGVAVFSFRQQLLTVSNIKTTGLNRVINYYQLRSTIESMAYYAVETYDNLNQPMKQVHHFFLGQQNRFTYITNNPIFSKKISVAQLECKDKQLVYYEEPLYSRIDFMRPSILTDSSSKLFFTDVNNCEIKYIFKGEDHLALYNDIPDAIQMILSDKEKDFFTLYVNIKSDANLTASKVYGAMYEE